MSGSSAPPNYRPIFGWWRRLPVTFQTETAECGLACLAMILGFYGYACDLAILRQKANVSARGITLTWLIKTAESFGLQARPLRLDVHEVYRLHVPCVLHYDLNHFVVLKRVSKKRVVIHDPASGVRRQSYAEFSRNFTGVAVELSPGQNFRTRNQSERFNLTALTGRITGLWSSLVQLLGYALVIELFALLVPLFTQVVVDRVIPTRDSNLLLLLSGGFVLLILLRVVVELLRGWAVTCISTSLNVSWTTNVFTHLLKLPEDYFQRRHIGDIVSRFGAIEAIQQTITTRSVEVVLDGVMAVMTLLMLLAYSKILSLIIVGSLIIYLIARFLFYGVLKDCSLGQITAMAKQQSFLLESLRGARTIRVHNQRSMHAARFMNLAIDTVNKKVTTQSLQLAFGGLSSVIFGAQKVVILGAGALLTLKGHFSVGMLMAFASYGDQFTTRASSLVDFGIQLKMLRLQGDRLADIVLTDPERFDTGVNAGAIETAAYSVSCVGVSYRYGDLDPWVLHDCSLQIPAGKCVAIVGPSGCGKSTFAKLLTGVYDPQHGSIKIAGLDIHQLGKSGLREVIGAVFQDDILFSGSVADNISFFDPTASMEDIEAAATLAGVHKEIVAFPMQYKTLIGDLGCALSGGQKQRIFIARALFRKPKILILDEATSHLDTESERVVSDYLASLDVTRIIIAHRAETIARADLIFELHTNRLYAH